MTHCYAVASGKGGVGKSAVSANLAAVLAQDGARVLVMDADIGLRSLDALLSLEDSVVYDLLDLIRGDCGPEQAILTSAAFPSLHLLPAAQFARARELAPKKLQKLLQRLSQSYDYVLIDCPAGIERGLRNVLNAGVRNTLLVTTPDDISVRSAERALQLISEKTRERPALIVNRLNEELICAGEMMTAGTVASVLDLPLLGEIPEDLVFCRALSRHKLVAELDCEARNAFCRIAARMEGKTVPFPAYGAKKPSILRRLFRSPLKEVTPLDDH